MNKFRAFDKFKGENIYLPETGDIDLEEAGGKDFKMSECEDIIIQQYIGVKDIAGIDIGEGDIIKGEDPSGEEIDTFTVRYNEQLTGYFFDYDGDYYSIGHAIDQGFEFLIDGNEDSI